MVPNLFISFFHNKQGREDIKRGTFCYRNNRIRDIYLLTTAAEAEEDTPRRAEMGLTGWIDCYGKSSLKGHLFCGGVNDARDIEGNNKLQEAYEMGKGV